MPAYDRLLTLSRPLGAFWRLVDENGMEIEGRLAFETVDPYDGAWDLRGDNIIAVRATYNGGALPLNGRVVGPDAAGAAETLRAGSVLRVGAVPYELGGADFAPMAFGALPDFGTPWRMFVLRHESVAFQEKTGLGRMFTNIEIPAEPISTLRATSWWNAAWPVVDELISTPGNTAYPLVADSPPTETNPHPDDGTRINVPLLDRGVLYRNVEHVTAAGNGSETERTDTRWVTRGLLFQAFPQGWFDAVPAGEFAEVLPQFQAKADIAYAFLKTPRADRLPGGTEVTFLSSAAENVPIWAALDFASTGEVIAVGDLAVTTEQQSRWRIARRQFADVTVSTTMVDDTGMGWNIVSVDEDADRGQLVLNCERTV